MSSPIVLIGPADPSTTHSAMGAFLRFAGSVHPGLSTYADLASFATGQPDRFWPLLARFSELPLHGDLGRAREGTSVEVARFFPEVRLNYAEALLRPLADDDAAWPALEAHDETGLVSALSRGELRRAVERVAAGLTALGIGEGDHVAAIARNDAATVVCALATAAIGAVWSSVAPDLGREAVLDRFRQFAPVVLFAHATQRYHGTRRPAATSTSDAVGALPSLRAVVALDPEVSVPDGQVRRIAFEELTALGDLTGLGTWPRLPFDHPLFVLYSSGTTGAPKGIIHGAGGTLLEHWKELRLHTDLGPGDALFYQTTAGWMMWNWQLSALSTGAKLVLYDGSATFPGPAALWELADRAGVTVFGTNAAFLQLCADMRTSPRLTGALTRLRAVLSTGSILLPAQYDWIMAEVKAVPIHSISGGTDIIGCFVLGNPLLPVHRGESPCVSLGLDVRAWTDGRAERVGTGELVCVAPFPSRPVGLLGDPDRSRFHRTYFGEHEGMWTHGDLIELTDRGTARILGRSDGTLNVRGVRIGPAEIYGIVKSMPEVMDAMAIEQRAPREPGGSRVVLLLVLAHGVVLDRPLTLRVKRELKERASANHVPSVIAQVTDLPTTHNGKRSERAARDALNGLTVENLAALRNPEILDALRSHPNLLLRDSGSTA